MSGLPFRTVTGGSGVMRNGPGVGVDLGGEAGGNVGGEAGANVGGEAGGNVGGGVGLPQLTAKSRSAVIATLNTRFAITALRRSFHVEQFG